MQLRCYYLEQLGLPDRAAAGTDLCPAPLTAGSAQWPCPAQQGCITVKSPLHSCCQQVDAVHTAFRGLKQITCEMPHPAALLINQLLPLLQLCIVSVDCHCKFGIALQSIRRAL